MIEGLLSTPPVFSVKTYLVQYILKKKNYQWLCIIIFDIKHRPVGLTEKEDTTIFG